MCFNKTGSELATCQDGKLKIWAADSFKLIKSVELLSQCSKIEFSPDDKYLLALPKSSNLASVLQTSDYSLINSEFKVLPAASGADKQAFSNDGKFWANASYSNHKL